MSYTRPIPVEKDKLKVGHTYYTCSHTGAIKVIILKIFTDSNSVQVVMTSKGKQKNKPFIRLMKYVFDNSEMAKSAGREWEHNDRKRRKNKGNKKQGKK